MENKDIFRLGPEAFAREVTPGKKDHKPKDWPVVGFDTEYDSATRRLLSWQIADEQGGRLTEARGRKAIPLGELVRDTARARTCKYGERKDVVLVTYFSLAELQFLPVFEKAFRIREFAKGSLDCTLEEGGVRLHVFDLARFFDRSGLKEAAEAFGLRKLKYDTSKVTLRSLRDPRFVRYAIHDADITREIFVRLREAYVAEGADILRCKTPASTAAAVFRHRYLRGSVGVPDARVRGLALRCCWGGRAEAFARKRWPRLHEYDLESAYPAATAILRCMPRAADWQPLRRLTGLSAWCGGFARVLFSFPSAERYPCLPVAAKGSLLYPLRGESFCTLAEVQLAQRIGAKLTLLDGFVYRTGTADLATMMADVRARRAAATGAQRVALKLMANSLIGKFIQHKCTPGAADVEQLAKELRVPIADLKGLSPDELEALGLRVGFRIGGLWCPEWNGLITGVVRAQISDLARRTGAVYCATDAVWTESELRKLPPGLALKREGEAIVARTRLGAIWPAHVVHHAWSSRKAAKRALRDVKGPQQRRYKRRRPLHFGEALRREVPVGTWIEETRCGSLVWDGKRRLSPDGSSQPWKSVLQYLDARQRQTIPPPSTSPPSGKRR